MGQVSKTYPDHNGIVRNVDVKHPQEGKKYEGKPGMSIKRAAQKLVVILPAASTTSDRRKTQLQIKTIRQKTLLQIKTIRRKTLLQIKTILLKTRQQIYTIRRKMLLQIYTIRLKMLLQIDTIHRKMLLQIYAIRGKPPLQIDTILRKTLLQIGTIRRKTRLAGNVSLTKLTHLVHILLRYCLNVQLGRNSWNYAGHYTYMYRSEI